MRKTTNTVKNRSNSKFLGRFRRLYNLRTSKTKPANTNFDFLRENQGTLTSETISAGIIKVKFSSKQTGRSALAFGPTMGEAYNNMITKFNIKYAV